MEKLENIEKLTRSEHELLDLWQEKLKRSEWQIGKLIGSDLALSQKFGYSRTVVRGVIEFLAEHNCISKIPRMGVKLEKRFILEASKSIKQEAEKVLFVRWDDNPFFLDILAGVNKQAAKSNFSVLQRMAAQNEKNLIQILEKIPQGCKSVLIAPMEIPEIIVALQKLVDEGIKVVQFDRYIEGLGAPSVVFDNYQGGSLATSHLLEKHNLPVHYFGCLNVLSVRKRYQGWRDQMQEAGFDNLENYFIRVPQILETENSEELYAKFCKILTAKLKNSKFPISIFAQSDSWAKIVYDVAKNMNLEIGKDIFLVGFDNLRMCERLTPKLSSIMVNRQQLGVEIIKMLVENLYTNADSCKILPVELIERESSGL